MSEIVLTNRLKRAEETTLASLLRRTLPSSTGEVDGLLDVPYEEASLLRDALIAAGVSRESVTENYSARARLRDVLASAIQYKVFAKPVAKKVRERLALEGGLPLSQYRLTADKDSRWMERSGLTLSDARKALESPYFADNYVLSPDSTGTRGAIRIVLATTAHPDRLILVLADVMKDQMKVVTYLLVHRSDLERRRVTSAVEAFRAFLDEYGVAGRVSGGRTDVLYLAEVVRQRASDRGSTPLYESSPPNGMSIQFYFMHRFTALHVVEVGYAFSINVDKYMADRRLFPVR